MNNTPVAIANPLPYAGWSTTIHVDIRPWLQSRNPNAPTDAQTFRALLVEAIARRCAKRYAGLAVAGRVVPQTTQKVVMAIYAPPGEGKRLAMVERNMGLWLEHECNSLMARITEWAVKLADVNEPPRMSPSEIEYARQQAMMREDERALAQAQERRRLREWGEPPPFRLTPPDAADRPDFPRTRMTAAEFVEYATGSIPEAHRAEARENTIALLTPRGAGDEPLDADEAKMRAKYLDFAAWYTDATPDELLAALMDAVEDETPPANVIPLRRKSGRRT